MLQIVATERVAPEQREEYQFFQCYRCKDLATSFHLVFWSQQSDCGWIVRKNGIWKKVHMINEPELKEHCKYFETSSQKSLQIL